MTNRLVQRGAGFLGAKRWRLIQRSGLANRTINREVDVIDLASIASAGIATGRLDLTTAEYRAFVTSPALAWYACRLHPQAKPLEYLTTTRLLNLADGDTVLDAAGGTSREYPESLRAATGKTIEFICQDSQLEGTVYDGIRFVGGSIDELPLADASIDAISCHHSMEHFRGDTDVRFVREMIRLLKPGGRLVVVPLFLGTKYAEFWNRRPEAAPSADGAVQIVDRLGSFCGWGPYEHFARVYSLDAFRTRLLQTIGDTARAEVVGVYLDGAPTPDLAHNAFQPRVNGHMKALVLTRTTGRLVQ